jgi:hypothetical protein
MSAQVARDLIRLDNPPKLINISDSTGWTHFVVRDLWRTGNLTEER